MGDALLRNPVVHLRELFEGLPAVVHRPIEMVVFGGDLPQANISRMRWLFAELRDRAAELDGHVRDVGRLLAQQDSLGAFGDELRTVLGADQDAGAKLRERALALADYVEAAANEAEKTLCVMFAFGIELGWRIVRIISAAGAAGPAAQVAAAAAVESELTRGRAEVEVMRTGLRQALEWLGTRAAAKLSAMGPVRFAVVAGRAALLPVAVDGGVQLLQVGAGYRNLSPMGDHGRNPTGIDVRSILAAGAAGAGGAIGGTLAARAGAAVFPGMLRSRTLAGLAEGAAGGAAGLSVAAMITGWPKDFHHLLASVLNGAFAGTVHAQPGAHPGVDSAGHPVVGRGGLSSRPGADARRPAWAAVLAADINPVTPDGFPGRAVAMKEVDPRHAPAASQPTPGPQDAPRAVGTQRKPIAQHPGDVGPPTNHEFSSGSTGLAARRAEPDDPSPAGPRHLVANVSADSVQHGGPRSEPRAVGKRVRASLEPGHGATSVDAGADHVAGHEASRVEDGSETSGLPKVPSDPDERAVRDRPASAPAGVRPVLGSADEFVARSDTGPGLASDSGTGPTGGRWPGHADPSRSARIPAAPASPTPWTPARGEGDQPAFTSPMPPHRSVLAHAAVPQRAWEGGDVVPLTTAFDDRLVDDGRLRTWPRNPARDLGTVQAAGGGAGHGKRKPDSQPAPEAVEPSSPEAPPPDAASGSTPDGFDSHEDPKAQNYDWRQLRGRYEIALARYLYNSPATRQAIVETLRRVREVTTILHPEATPEQIDEAFFAPEIDRWDGIVQRSVPLEELLRDGNPRELMAALLNAMLRGGERDPPCGTTLDAGLIKLFRRPDWEARAAELRLDVPALRCVRESLLADKPANDLTFKDLRLIRHTMLRTDAALRVFDEYDSRSRSDVQSRTAQNVRRRLLTVQDWAMMGMPLSHRELEAVPGGLLVLRVNRLDPDGIPRDDGERIDVDALEAQLQAEDSTVDSVLPLYAHDENGRRVRDESGQSVVRAVLVYRDHGTVDAEQALRLDPRRYAVRIRWRPGGARYEFEPNGVWFQDRAVDNGIPVLTGISGTSARMMARFNWLCPPGVSERDFAGAVIAAMLPHHTDYEIVQALRMAGVSLVDGAIMDATEFDATVFYRALFAAFGHDISRVDAEQAAFYEEFFGTFGSEDESVGGDTEPDDNHSDEMRSGSTPWRHMQNGNRMGRR